LSRIDKVLTKVVLRMQKAKRRIWPRKVVKPEPSENMKRLWELNGDLDREVILDE